MYEVKWNKFKGVCENTNFFLTNLTEMPKGVIVSLTTTIQVVVTFLQHSTKSDPILCTSILSILLDNLRKLEPLSLSKWKMNKTSKG